MYVFVIVSLLTGRSLRQGMTRWEPWRWTVMVMLLVRRRLVVSLPSAPVASATVQSLVGFCICQEFRKEMYVLAYKYNILVHVGAHVCILVYMTAITMLSKLTESRSNHIVFAGSGGYADNDSGAVSTTGHGESILKVCLAHSITTRMQQGATTRLQPPIHGLCRCVVGATKRRMEAQSCTCTVQPSCNCGLVAN